MISSVGANMENEDIAIIKKITEKMDKNNNIQGMIFFDETNNIEKYTDIYLLVADKTIEDKEYKILYKTNISNFLSDLNDTDDNSNNKKQIFYTKIDSSPSFEIGIDKKASEVTLFFKGKTPHGEGIKIFNITISLACLLKKSSIFNRIIRGIFFGTYSQFNQPIALFIWKNQR